MRISTSMIYDMGVAGIQKQTSDLLKTNMQVASGRRILTPKDDPVGAARVLEVSQAKSLNQQYDVNTDSTSSALSLEETALDAVNNLLLDVRTSVIDAGGPLMDQTKLAGLATSLRGRYQELLGLANSTDGNGQYMFSGYKGAVQPFTQTSPGNVTYNGDQGQRLIQVSPSRQIAASDAGSDVFQQIKSGNGIFVTAAAATNTGTGLLTPGSVVTAYDGNDYQVDFTVAAGVTTYTVTNLTTSVIGPSTPYVSGNAIPVGGGQFTVSGAPANGDSFTLNPSSNEDIFKTLNNLITALETPTDPITPAEHTTLLNNLTTAISNLDNGRNQVLKVQASIGTRMQEVEAIKVSGMDVALQYDMTLSDLQDLDYAKGITDLTRYQTGLEAAQKSFLKIQGLSLFNYM
ncbi:MAG: flagellar hook-associated protein FlgL [Sulfuricellaceae bacterium]|nr:flagellar hook-associated protein FlgL [Sulfuricellaceae bacterium]